MLNSAKVVNLQEALYSHRHLRHLVIAAHVLPVLPVYAKKLSLLTTLSPKESPKYYAVPKEPLKDLYYAAPKEPSRISTTPPIRNHQGSLRRRP